MAQNYTPAPAPPPDDTIGDAIVQEILTLILRELEPILPRLGTVTSITGNNAQVSVQDWDDETGGQQFRARAAGINFKAGDQVLMVPTGTGEYVVTNVIANTNQQKAVIGTAEVENNAIRRQHIADAEITPAKINPAYTQQQTQAMTQHVAAAITPFATTTYVNSHVANQIATRQPVGSYATQGQLDNTNAQLASKSPVGHRHFGSDVEGLMTTIKVIKDALGCLNSNITGTTKNPCGAKISPIPG